MSVGGVTVNPRESSLLNAAAVLLARHGQDAAYGPAHAVRDALALETEVSQQVQGAILWGASPDNVSLDNLRKVAAL